MFEKYKYMCRYFSRWRSFSELYIRSKCYKEKSKILFIRSVLLIAAEISKNEHFRRMKRDFEIECRFIIRKNKFTNVSWFFFFF